MLLGKGSSQLHKGNTCPEKTRNFNAMTSLHRNAFE